MVDYEFYTAVYLGSSIPEKAFPGVAAQAEAELDRIKRYCRVSCPGEASEKMALCAMAEAVYDGRQRQGLRSASLGGVSVQYDDKSRRRAIYEAAGIYLDIYRGVGV